MYVQDFDVIFERDTDPIDLFCMQHSAQVQKQLLQEMKDFYQEVLAGKKRLKNIVNMGLGYLPWNDHSPEVWLPLLIRYLEKKTA